MTNPEPDPYPGAQFPAPAGDAYVPPAQHPPSGAPFPPNNAAVYPPNAGQPHPGYFYPASKPNNSMALTSLILGILSLVCLGPLLGIPAIITGVVARRQIAESAGSQGGAGQALWGIIIGVASCVLTAVIAFLFLVLGVASSTGTPTYVY